MKRLLTLLLCTLLLSLSIGMSVANAFTLDVDTVNFDPKDGDTGVALSYPTTLQFVFTNPVDKAALHNDINPNTGWRISVVEVATGTAVIYPLQDSYLTTVDGKTWLLTLPVQLKSNTQYRVTLSPLITHEADYSYYLRGIDTLPTAPDLVNGGYTYTFTTASAADTIPPEVAFTSPLGGSTNIPVNTSIAIQFSEAMMAGGADSAANYTLTAGGSPVAFSFGYDSTTNAATLTPASNLNQNTTYTVTVSGSVQDLAGNAMGANYTFSFTTYVPDTVRPTVVGSSPASGETSVLPTTTISIIFSEEMDPATINTTNITVSGGVTGTVAYLAGSRTAIFTPSAALNLSTNYTVTVGTGVKDLAGNALLQPYSFTFTTAKSLSLANINDYCQTPPFLGGAGVMPNVLVVYDNSGSMAEFAYKTPGKGDSAGSGADQSYNPATLYGGYFVPEKMYKYNSSPGNFIEDTSKTLNKSSFWSGNFLNWLTMRRVDMVRKVLVGGKTSPRSANTANYLIPYEDPDRDYYKTYATTEGGYYKYYKVTGSKIYLCKTSSCSIDNSTTSYIPEVYVGNDPPQDGLFLQYADKIRFGVMNFGKTGRKYEYKVNSDADGGSTLVQIAGNNGNDLATLVQNTDPSTWTPLAETMYETTRYFQAITGAYTNQNYGATSWDPIQNSCQRSFVVILTDGESTMDLNLPNTYFNPAGATKVTDPYGAAGLDIKVWMNSITAQENDGTDYYKTYANTSYGSYYLPGVTYYANNTDLRTATMGKNDIANKQNITTYTVFAFDDSPVGKKICKLAAKYGGYDDANGNGKPDPGEWDRKISGVPDTYYEATGSSDLGAKLGEVFNDILRRVSSGTAASILNNSEGSGASLLQAVFYPEKSFDTGSKVTWIGELQNLWFYLDPYLQRTSIRVDTVADYKLNLLDDYVSQFYFDSARTQTLVSLMKDVNGDGSTLQTIGTSYNPDDTTNVKSLWRAGRMLWGRNLTTEPRKIWTHTGLAAYDIEKNSANEYTGLALFDTSLAANTTIQTYLQAANSTEATKIIQYVRGIDQASYRNRVVTIDGVSGTWRLGDIISSTPKIQANVGLNTYDKPSPSGYADASYAKYIASNDYKNRGMVYVGANDGMLHAFRMGVLQELTDPCRASGADQSTCFADKARFNNDTTTNTTPLLNTKNGANAGIQATTTDKLGKEEWAFVPTHVMPYLKYLGDPLYPHLFYVDGPSLVIDSSIYNHCGATNYWDCDKQTRLRTDYGTNNLDVATTSWRTILIGSTGLGGASRNRTYNCITNPGTDCVKTPVDNLGYSSYFALDVTNPKEPKYLWQFFGDTSYGGNLGYATTGPVIVRTGGKDKNGRWFAVFASGPTGPIDTINHQFQGRSDMQLKIFIVDLATGSLVREIFTGITNAFAGSMSNGAIDTDRSIVGSNGYYQDDAIYLGYVQKDTSVNPNTWTKGGVVRLLTKESTDPNDWVFSKVIEDTASVTVGPVTTAIAKLQDRGNGRLWLYFGTGRYYFKTASAIDDRDSRRRLFGIQEPCYNQLGYVNDINPNCTDKFSGSLRDQTTTIATSLTSAEKGWYVDLDASTTIDAAERVITDPVASPAGAVFFTTFKPNNDVCGFGGTSFIWALDYATGGTARSSALTGKVMLQVSTGAFAEVSLGSQMTAKDGRRSTDGIQGVPPKAQGLSLMVPPKPVKKILQIQEK
ncbi:Ig-like domain-containing protein [Trichlorobacter lovleyi]|uniref:Ig-like domain-containing protein n=1 Tax=Trichlorobacter lovleyi TaxID=313985 RepID=UPI0023F07E7E|nr:Ig-like domain-containing protein [Trichlorobacter lovleyi]